MAVVKLDVIVDNKKILKLDHVFRSKIRFSICVIFAEYLSIYRATQWKCKLFENTTWSYYIRLKLGEDMHNSVIVSCFTRDLQYCLNVEYKIKDKMQVGYNGTECPIKELCSNLEPILRLGIIKEIRQPTCST